MDNTEYLAKRISEINGIKLAAKPVINVLGITTKNGKSICELDEEFRKKNWMLGKFMEFNLIRVVIMPHVRKEHLDHFLEDLNKLIKKLNIC